MTGIHKEVETEATMTDMEIGTEFVKHMFFNWTGVIFLALFLLDNWIVYEFMFGPR